MRRNRKIQNAQAVGIYKSRLEKKMADCLEERGIVADYEKHTFVLVEKFRFENKSYKGKQGHILLAESAAIRQMTYTPDFVSIEYNFIVECKGFPNDAFPLKWKLFKKYLVENNLDYDLYIPRNKLQCEVVADQILFNIQNQKQDVRGTKSRTSKRSKTRR